MTAEGLTAGGKKRDARSYAAEERFRARVAELGGVVLEESWKGTKTPHRVRCANGHEGSPRPQSVNIGNGLCERCGFARPYVTRSARSYAAEERFRARVAELGGVVLEESWKGNDHPHRVRCAKGHLCAPRPGNVANGQGPCVVCSWSSQDVVYVVSGSVGVKLGITSGDPQQRLSEHRRDGYGTVLRCWRGLPPGVAFQSEQDALKWLRSSGARPVRGREYFEAEHTSMIVDVLAALLHPHL